MSGAGRLEVVEVPAASARAVQLRTGDRLRVIDVEGSQVADLVAFAAEDPDEYLAQAYTRVMLERTKVRVGDQLFSNRMRPLLTIVEDTVGVHDIEFPPCSTRVYELMFDVHGRTGCREHLAGALEPFGVAAERVTDPFNAFMHTRDMQILLPTSRAGDYVELRAERDLLVAVSACAGDMNDCNAGRLTDIRLEVRRAG